MTGPDAARDAALAVDALLDRAIGALTGGTSDDRPAVGRSPDERVTATVTATAVTALELDPRVLRDGADALAASVVAAVNAAVDSRPPRSSGPEQRAAELRAVKEESQAQAAQFRRALQEQLERLATGAQDGRS